MNVSTDPFFVTPARAAELLCMSRSTFFATAYKQLPKVRRSARRVVIPYHQVIAYAQSELEAAQRSEKAASGRSSLLTAEDSACADRVRARLERLR